jgi:hypothetical protein
MHVLNFLPDGTHANLELAVPPVACLGIYAEQYLTQFSREP